MFGANAPLGVGTVLPRPQHPTSVADWNDPITAASWPSSGNYLNNLSSWFQAVQFLLSLFAIFVIFRHCLQRWSPWLTGIDAKNAAYSITDNPNFSPSLLTIEKRHHQRFYPRHRLKPPLPWFYHLPEIMEEKQRDKAFSNAPTGPPPASSQSQSQPQLPKTATQHPGQDDDVLATGRTVLTLNQTWNNSSADRHLISRPPPAPPLTPPDLNNTVYTLDARPISQGFPDSFLHQPNPDYTTASFTAMSTSQSSGGSSHKRSFSKTVPIGVPRRQSSMSDPDQADLTISPNSYPPTSPFLPPAPPLEPREDSPSHKDGRRPPEPRPEVDAHGEFISVRSPDGGSWTRHTRVYGGGICLACAAAGGDGGFYGSNVRPEEMR